MEEALAPILQPDVLLPTQYWETVSRKHHLQPEKKLMLAVLEDAVWTYRKYLFSHKATFTEVQDWFLEENGDWLFSFENICDVLGLNPERIRKGLLHANKNESAGDAHIRLSPQTKTRQRHGGLDSNIWSRRAKEQRATIAV